VRREHLDAVAAGVNLLDQKGIAVDVSAYRVIDTASSPAVFRETVFSVPGEHRRRRLPSPGDRRRGGHLVARH
jgi:hypothetical protein